MFIIILPVSNLVHWLPSCSGKGSFFFLAFLVFFQFLFMAEKFYKNVIFKKMPKSQEHNIFISLSLWANKRKAIYETVMLGFEYPLFIFSLILTFIKPCVPSYRQASLLSSILLPPHPSPAKHSTYLFAALLRCKQTFLYLNLLPEYSFCLLDWAYLSPLQPPIEDIACSLPYPKNLRIQSQWHILPQPHCNLQTIILLSLPLFLLCVLSLVCFD